MNKVYIAASYSARELAKEVADMINIYRDYYVVSTWHDNPQDESVDKLKKYAYICIDQIKQANLFVYLSTPDESKGGKDFELGFARGTNKHILYVGDKTHIFSYMEYPTDIPSELYYIIENIVRKYMEKK